MNCGGAGLGAAAGASPVLTKSCFHLKRPIQAKETISFGTWVDRNRLSSTSRSPLHLTGLQCIGFCCACMAVVLMLTAGCSGLGEARAADDLHAAELSPVLFNLEMQN